MNKIQFKNKISQKFYKPKKKSQVVIQDSTQNEDSNEVIKIVDSTNNANTINIEPYNNKN